MPLVTIYALESHDRKKSGARLNLARLLAEPTAEMVARVINSFTGDDGLTKNEVLANPEALDSETWNAPPLWLHVRLGQTSLLEEKVHQLRNLMSEGFRALLLDPRFEWAVQRGEVGRFDIEVTFLDGCGHTMNLNGDLLASWGDKCESDRTTHLIGRLKG